MPAMLTPRAWGLAVAVVTAVLAVLWQRAAFEAPPPSLLLLDRHGAFLAQTGGTDATGYGYWPVDPVPERVSAAILAVEDHRFAVHPGVDPVAVVRSVAERLGGGGRSGGSTIAMQVARMQHPGPRTLARKLVEAATAVVMTARYGRDAVLRQYLRLVPLGNGSHGVAHAARWYLDKPVADLSWAEIAFLTAIPQAPGRANPFTEKGFQRAVKRGHKVLARLHGGGLLGDSEFTLAESQIEQLAIPARAVRPPEALHAVLRLERLLAAAPPTDPVVVTALDLGVQRRVQAMARASLEEWSRRGAQQVAVVVQDRATREVLAWVGSADYASAQAGAIDFARVTRSPGSALKPFLYALGLERGRIAANTVLADLPETQWGIENADHDFLGPMLPRQALATSRNLPAAAVLHRTGLDETHLFLAALGLHDNHASAAHYGLVLAVGALPTTLERLMRAYGVLADDGRLAEPVWWRGQPVPEPQRVLSAATARQIGLFLSDPMARLPTFPRLGASRDDLPIAVKTGTSQGYRDAWAVAWTGGHLVGVWTGRAKGTAMRAVTGAQSSATLAQAVLVALRHDASDRGPSFPAPPGYRPVELCAKTGLRAAGRCNQTLTEWFAEGRTPEEDDVFQAVRVDLRNGLLAAPWTPARYVARRTFAAFPPEHANWAAANALPPPPLDLSPLDRPGGRRRVASTTAPVDPAAPPTLRVVAPRDGLHVVRNPETPPDADVLPLRAAVDARVTRVVWQVDGQPWRTAGPHEPAYWPLRPGRHRFQATTVDGAYGSPVVEIVVE